MTPLRRFAFSIAPVFALAACAELIGLSDYEKGDVAVGGEGGEAEGARASGGTAGKGGQGGSNTGGTGTSGRGGKGGQGGTGAVGLGGEGGEGGDMSMGGEPSGGTAGNGGGVGGSGARAGAGGSGGKGGSAGNAGSAGMAGGGMAGTGGQSGGAGSGGMAGSGGGSCTTVPVAIRSAGFDTDTGVWVGYDDGMGPTTPIIVAGATVGLVPNTPPNLAHFGGRNNDYAGHYQSFVIPAGAITLTLTGFRQITTAETSTSVFDEMRIQVWEDAFNALGFVGQFVAFSNANASTGGWVSFMGTVAVGAYAGQPVDLDMWGDMDVSNISDFYIDSMVMTAFVCQ